MTTRQPLAIEVKPVEKGSASYETTRAAILTELASKIPKEYLLPQEIIANPPLDVTDIPRTCGILSQHELDITEKYDAVALVQATSTGTLSAVDVATAFCKRAAIAHQLSCCLTDYFVEEALERAKYLDEYLKTHGRPVGPLHGCPISVKEHLPLKGHYSSWGFLVTRSFSEEDSLMVRSECILSLFRTRLRVLTPSPVLRDAGAIFYVKTNQPQAIMHLECTGFHGRTLNPSNISLSSGGSSGGEAALVALRGSVLGIGTDIGGSIRGPAGFCGIYGFKATAYTLPCKDFIPGGFAAELNVLASTGPMASSLRDAELFVNVIKAGKPHLEDPRVLPFPWTGFNTKIDLPLKIGIMTHDGQIVPQPPVLKALKWAEQQLSGVTNVTTKPFMPYKAATAMSSIRIAYWPDSGLPDIRACEATGEPWHPLSDWIIKDVKGERERTGSEVNELRFARDTYRSEFAMDWNRQDVDFVLCPVFVGPASAHDTAFYWNYTALFNYVDYPGIVFPTPIRAGKEKEDYPAEFSTPLGPEDEHVRQMWRESNFENAPINLQLVARKHHDNELFGALAILKDALKLQ